jgi:hypothetical protein
LVLFAAKDGGAPAYARRKPGGHIDRLLQRMPALVVVGVPEEGLADV